MIISISSLLLSTSCKGGKHYQKVFPVVEYDITQDKKNMKKKLTTICKEEKLKLQYEHE